MISQRSRYSFIAAGCLTLVAFSSEAKDLDRPPAIKALETQGLKFVQEFNVGSDIRAFAGMTGDRPIAVYVMNDGKAIVGARVNSKGEPLDEVTVDRLVAKPMTDRVWSQLESATWVLDGNAGAPRIVYTFSDPNCPYCNRFWEAARPWVESGKVQLRHLLVGIIKADSPTKAAAILGAPDRSAALHDNEKKAKQGGITPAKNISSEVRRILDENQALMISMGFGGTPGIVVRDSKGTIKKYHGLPRQDALTEVLGPR